jgi:hypothetical protein
MYFPAKLEEEIGYARTVFVHSVSVFKGDGHEGGESRSFFKFSDKTIFKHTTNSPYVVSRIN